MTYDRCIPHEEFPWCYALSCSGGEDPLPFPHPTMVLYHTFTDLSKNKGYFRNFILTTLQSRPRRGRDRARTLASAMSRSMPRRGRDRARTLASAMSSSGPRRGRGRAMHFIAQPEMRSIINKEACGDDSPLALRHAYRESLEVQEPSHRAFGNAIPKVICNAHPPRPFPEPSAPPKRHKG
jgi:hypothetical protein